MVVKYSGMDDGEFVVICWEDVSEMDIEKKKRGG